MVILVGVQYIGWKGYKLNQVNSVIVFAIFKSLGTVLSFVAVCSKDNFPSMPGFIIDVYIIIIIATLWILLAFSVLIANNKPYFACAVLLTIFKATETLVSFNGSLLWATVSVIFIINSFSTTVAILFALEIKKQNTTEQHSVKNFKGAKWNTSNWINKS